jgi:hypothetical protein
MEEAYEYAKQVKCLTCTHNELCGSGLGGVNMCASGQDCPYYNETKIESVKEDSTLEELLIERMKAELAAINVGIDLTLKAEVREDILDGTLRMTLGELSNAIFKGALAEYFLVIGDYELAKNYHKQYTKELKELL